MNCKDVREQLSAYVDKYLDREIEEEVKKHIEGCQNCRKEYKELIEIKRILDDVPMVELPKNFKEELHDKLVNCYMEDSKQLRENSKIMQFKDRLKYKINFKIISTIAASLLLAVILVGGMKNYINFSQSQFQKEFAEEEIIEGYDDEIKDLSLKHEGFSAQKRSLKQDLSRKGENYSDAINKKALFDDTGRKIILNGYIRLNVENYDKIQKDIMDLIVSMGGYIENSHTSYRFYNEENPEKSLKSGNLIVRVPENQFYNVFDKIKSMGITVDEGIDSTDITEQYRDTVSEIENLKVREKRLREIMNKAKNVKEIIEVERELSRVRGQINRYTGNIKKWDSLVSLSTIKVFLNEIEVKDKNINIIDKNIWQKSKKGFIKTTNYVIKVLENLIVILISFIPIIMIVLVLFTIILYLYKKYKKQKNNF
ncbi:Putative zinc-finger [Caminicella sporogenes DSM 14501]|uniref:Anti-sigma-W factor RsiW n=1 Tax=Caminicella sporogenes DSM 14501 TaxID=1121266 RepID=A0A1M6LYW1_9FIRM|nr:DUF4349 domain-containing protein [Caminicella sporogenes]RKD27999.1 hypothetical protein BET04_02775 [Caminicella sporogenes]SHJ76365.1 Putative zinc-finger [Caminicella sporogenes DSM 14501]